MMCDAKATFAGWTLISFATACCVCACGEPVPAIKSGSATVKVESSTDPKPNLVTKAEPSEPAPPTIQPAEAEPEIGIQPASDIDLIEITPIVETKASEVKATVPSEEQLARWRQPEFEPLQLLARYPSEGLSFVSYAVSSTDGEWLALGGDKLTLWKPLSKKPVATLWDIKANEESESIKSLAIDPSGQWIAAGDADGTLRQWNLNNQEEMASKKIYSNDIVHIAVSDDGGEIATGTYGKEISILDSKTLSLKKTFEVDINGQGGLLYASPKKLAVAGKALTVWDTTTGTLDKVLVEEGYVSSFARSADRSMFAVAEESKLRFLTSVDLSPSAELNGNFARNEILRPTSDGNFLWTANGAVIRGWDLASGRAVQTIDVNVPEVVGLDWIDRLKLLRVITEDGVIRYWGTVSNGLAAELKPLHTPIEIPDGHDVPTTTFELESMVDLRMLPQPPDSVATSGEATMLQIDSGNSPDDTKAFYRYVLEQRGWTELPGNVHTPDYLSFAKNGFKIFANLSASGTGRTSIYLTSLGNVDLRTLPRLDLPGFKTSYESDSNVSYQVGTDLVTIETELLKQFSTSGWVPYARLNSSHDEEANYRNMEFISNGMTLRVSIQPKPDEPSMYVVQYAAFVAQNHLPFPKDCDFIECDAARSPALVAKTVLSLNDCHIFYDRAMSKLGWLVADVKKSKDDDLRWLTYFRNQTEVRIRLAKVKEGGTWIVAGEYAEGNSWQLSKKDEPTTDVDKPKSSGIQAADVPIFKPSEATEVTYDQRQETIQIKLPKNSHVEIVDFYASQLGSLGWEEEPNGFRDEDYAFVTFTKDSVSVQVRVNSNSLGTTIGISDEGLMWDKALPESKTAISYEGWMRKNSHPASLKLLDQYIQEMRPLLVK